MKTIFDKSAVSRLVVIQYGWNLCELTVCVEFGESVEAMTRALDVLKGPKVHFKISPYHDLWSRPLRKALPQELGLS